MRSCHSELGQPVIVPRSPALVPTEINFLCRSFYRPTIEERFSITRNQKVEKFGKGKENKHENPD